jgi:hypothetical protein
LALSPVGDDRRIAMVDRASGCLKRRQRVCLCALQPSILKALFFAPVPVFSIPAPMHWSSPLFHPHTLPHCHHLFAYRTSRRASELGRKLDLLKGARRRRMVNCGQAAFFSLYNRLPTDTWRLHDSMADWRIAHLFNWSGRSLGICRYY